MRNFFRALLVTVMLAFPAAATVTAVTASPAGASWIDSGSTRGCSWYAWRDNARTGYFSFWSEFSSFGVSCQFPYRIQCQRPNGSTYWQGTYYGTVYDHLDPNGPSGTVYRSQKCGTNAKIIRVDVIASGVYTF